MSKQKPAQTRTEKENPGSGDEVASLSRGLTVLRRVATAGAPISNRELAELTGISKPSVSRITATLVSAGFLFQLPDSERFVLTAAVLELSTGFLRNFDIRARARPFLIELAESTSLSAHLVTHDRLDLVVIEAVKPRSAFLVSRLDIGSRIDMTRTAAGRAYLAALTTPQRSKLLTSLEVACGAEWPRVHARVESGLAEARTNGFVIVTGEWHESVNGIALGFVGPSGERYAVNGNGPAHQFSREWLTEHAAPALIECVTRIVAEIGGAPHLRSAD